MFHSCCILDSVICLHLAARTESISASFAAFVAEHEMLQLSNIVKTEKAQAQHTTHVRAAE